VVEYLDLISATARTDAAYWDSAANAMVPPKSTVPTTTTTGPAGTSPPSCFGCVTITDVTISTAAAPGTIPAECIATASYDYGGLGQVIGPNVTDPNRTFDVPFEISVFGGTLQDGTNCDYTYTMSVSTSTGSPVSIQSVDPPVPVSVPADSGQRFDVTFHVPNGNFYDGPITIYVSVG
ncbi:MAG TPA: hypothetical protein VK425_12880, partial [Acidimicrobiales bacterium]|nr:hypothetical protein [Acidimicrobiales bacterium]